ncbi:MAG: Lrp/AsnC family transcriptional regulator [Flavobacteriales bacterium]
MDSIDIKILNALQRNSRTSTTNISKELKISNVATQQRIQKLEKAGVIKGYTAMLDREFLGYKTMAYLGIFLDKAKDYPSVLKKLKEIPEVTEAHFTTGNYSIFAKILAKDNKHLMQILSHQLQPIKGISRTETFISLEQGIEFKELPISE